DGYTSRKASMRPRSGAAPGSAADAQNEGQRLAPRQPHPRCQHRWDSLEPRPGELARPLILRPETRLLDAIQHEPDPETHVQQYGERSVEIVLRVRLTGDTDPQPGLRLQIAHHFHAAAHHQLTGCRRGLLQPQAGPRGVERRVEHREDET